MSENKSFYLYETSYTITDKHVWTKSDANKEAKEHYWNREHVLWRFLIWEKVACIGEVIFYINTKTIYDGIFKHFNLQRYQKQKKSPPKLPFNDYEGFQDFEFYTHGYWTKWIFPGNVLITCDHKWIGPINRKLDEAKGYIEFKISNNKILYDKLSAHAIEFKP